VDRADLGVLAGQLVALTITGSESEPALTLWDVATGRPLDATVTMPEECTVGTLVTLDRQLLVIRGIDVSEDEGAYHPEEAADLVVVDVARRRELRRFRHRRGWSMHATVARSAAGAVVLVGADDWVVAMNPYRTGGAVEEFQYSAHSTTVTCIATMELDGRTVVASGDRGNAVHFWDLATREPLAAAQRRRD
jgi:hypothetical protein